MDLFQDIGLELGFLLIAVIISDRVSVWRQKQSSTTEREWKKRVVLLRQAALKILDDETCEDQRKHAIDDVRDHGEWAHSQGGYNDMLELFYHATLEMGDKRSRAQSLIEDIWHLIGYNSRFKGVWVK